MRELRERWPLPSQALLVLQLWTANKPLLPNLKMVDLSEVHELLIPFVSLLIPLGATSISLGFGFSTPGAMVASTVSSLPKLCPNSQAIRLHSLPRDPMIVPAVSGMVLASNRNTLQEFHVGIPLTKEANEVVFKLPSLRSLSVVIKRENSLPSASLPSLVKLAITCDKEGGWLQLFHEATFGKLEFVTLYPLSDQIGDFLETFERVALSSSIQHTLSTFRVASLFSWNPDYLSLLPFTQLVNLIIESSCGGGCSSRVDDDIVISLSRAMSKLEFLRLGDPPCEEPMTGATVKGLVALALHSPNLQHLCIRFQVASLSAPPESLGILRNAEPTGCRVDCALTTLEVGNTLAPEESVLMVASTLLRIFPHIENIYSRDEGWEKVEDAIRLSK